MQFRRALRGFAADLSRADAAALDVVGAGWPTREHGRFGGLDDGPVECG